MHDVTGIEIRDAERGDVGDEVVRPDVLADGDEDGAAE